MSDNNQDLKPKGNARRKLVRGAFAAPAVLSVYSGSASATSFLQCIVKQNASPISPIPGVVTASDRYLRYQLYGLVLISNPAIVDSYYVKGAELLAFRRQGINPYLPSGSWQAVGLNNVPGAITTVTPTKSLYRLELVNQYVVLQVNAAGKIVGVGNATGGSAIVGTCWNSFFAAAPP